MHAIVRRFDTDGDGCLGFEDFKRAFHVAGDDQQVLAAYSDRSAADPSSEGVDPLHRPQPQPDEDFKVPQRHCAPLRVQVNRLLASPPPSFFVSVRDSSGEWTQKETFGLRVQLQVATTSAGRELTDGDLAERFQVRLASPWST